jgi:pimeloyl-ACP methyl ester carboxylesterase
MGGRVGMILALTQPQVINKLVCVDATPVNTTVSIERWKTLGDACRLLKEMEPGKNCSQKLLEITPKLKTFQALT